MKFDRTPEHHTAFLHLKENLVQAPILYYPNPNKKYIVYTDASDDTCRAQLSQEHNSTELPVAFLSHTFTETQQKWSTTEQEAFGIYYAIARWNYYLQGTDIIVRNDHKPLAHFLNGKNTNNNINRWSLELATYKISFERISGARNKAADCLSRLVTPTSTTINMLEQFLPMMDQLSISEVMPRTPLTLLQLFTWIQLPKFPKSPLLHQNHSQLNIWMPYFKSNELTPFCKCISRRLLNGKVPHHEFDTSLMSKDFCTNTSQMLVRNSLPWSSPNLGNTQYWWKPMINSVIKEILTHIVSSNTNTIGKE